MIGRRYFMNPSWHENAHLKYVRLKDLPRSDCYKNVSELLRYEICLSQVLKFTIDALTPQLLRSKNKVSITEDLVQEQLQ